eukprot:6871730-Lingulodinium_polyedra.AAC.1
MRRPCASFADVFSSLHEWVANRTAAVSGRGGGCGCCRRPSDGGMNWRCGQQRRSGRLAALRPFYEHGAGVFQLSV